MKSTSTVRKNSNPAPAPQRKPTADDWWWTEIGAAQKAHKDFAAFWPSLVSQFGNPPEVAWVYELQARIKGAYPAGVPFASLGRRQLSGMVLLSRYWSESNLRPAIVQCAPTDYAMTPESGRRWLRIAADVDLESADGKIIDGFKAMLARLRARERCPRPSWLPKEGERRKPLSWQMIEAFDCVPAGGKIPRQIQSRRDHAREIWRELLRRGRVFNPKSDNTANPGHA